MGNWRVEDEHGQNQHKADNTLWVCFSLPRICRKSGLLHDHLDLDFYEPTARLETVRSHLMAEPIRAACLVKASSHPMKARSKV